MLALWLAAALSVRIEYCPAVICGGWKLPVTPEGSPATLNAASWENPLVLVSETSTVAVCPGSKVTALGPAASAKLDEATTVNRVVDEALCPFRLTVMGPVAAPDGITNDKFVEVALEIGATTVPPPS